MFGGESDLSQLNEASFFGIGLSSLRIVVLNLPWRIFRDQILRLFVFKLIPVLLCFAVRERRLHSGIYFLPTITKHGQVTFSNQTNA